MLLHKKQKEKTFRKVIAGSNIQTTWNEWIDVPSFSGGIVRDKVVVTKSLLGSIKSFLYKDEEVYTHYQLENGDLLKHKIVPKNALDGIWINPMILHPENDNIEPLVKKIQFQSSNVKMMSNEIKIEWEFIETENTLNKSGVSMMKNDTVNTGFELFNKAKLVGHPDSTVQYLFNSKIE